jgi:hypothetical protein
MKHRIFASSLLCSVVLMGPSMVLAQLPPPGSIYDLAVSHPGAVSGTETLFTTSFVAAAPSTWISFAFREVPAYWALDDTSVVLRLSSTNLLADPGFESATVGQNIPTGWSRWIQPIDVSAIGVVVSNTSSGGCSADTPTHGGTQFWCDGSVEGYDAVYQVISTTIGSTYDVSWWLGHNSGAAPSAPTIDMLVYATDGLPGGTVQVGAPEPASLSLIGAGIVMIGFALRRRRTA